MARKSICNATSFNSRGEGVCNKEARHTGRHKYDYAGESAPAPSHRTGDIEALKKAISEFVTTKSDSGDICDTGLQEIKEAFGDFDIPWPKVKFAFDMVIGLRVPDAVVRQNQNSWGEPQVQFADHDDEFTNALKAAVERVSFTYGGETFKPFVVKHTDTNACDSDGDY